MINRGNWHAPGPPAKGAAHELSLTQSPVGLRGARTGAWLVFINGAHRGEDLRLPVGVSVAGAGWKADLVLTGPGIGSRHARFTVGDGTATVAPEGSEREVLLNGERLARATEVMDGDLLSLAGLHGILRFAKAFDPGYRPALRPRVMPVPPTGDVARTATAAWLVALTGSRAGQDWRLVGGVNRFGSAIGLEVTWPEPGVPADACSIVCGAGGCSLGPLQQGVAVVVNGSPAAAGRSLRDSDRIAVAGTEFYLKCA
jgi:hypothetical protein